LQERVSRGLCPAKSFEVRMFAGRTLGNTLIVKTKFLLQ
jgi:hypothetical protein